MPCHQSDRLLALELLSDRLSRTLTPTDEPDADWINEQQAARIPTLVKIRTRRMICDIDTLVNSKRSRPDFTVEVITQIDVASVFIETLEAFGIPVAS